MKTEEQKQEYQSQCICDTECRGFVNAKCKQPKQETIEEVAVRIYPYSTNQVIEFANRLHRDSFIKGYDECLKHQYEKMSIEQDNFAIGFSEWIGKCEYNMLPNGMWKGDYSKSYWINELLEIYKKELNNK